MENVPNIAMRGSGVSFKKKLRENFREAVVDIKYEILEDSHEPLSRHCSR